SETAGSCHFDLRCTIYVVYDASYTTYIPCPGRPRQEAGFYKRGSPMGRLDPKLVEEAEEILILVRTLWRDLLRSPFAEAEQHGITGPQVRVMACLVRRGPLTVTELSRAVDMNHSTASGIVDRLQSRGLVRRTPDASDRRRTRVAVTEKVTQYVSELE